jgi:hypothetical protein
MLEHSMNMAILLSSSHTSPMRQNRLYPLQNQLYETHVKAVCGKRKMLNFEV